MSHQRTLAAIGVIALVALAACDRSPVANPVVPPSSSAPTSSNSVTGSVRPDGCAAGPITVVWTPDRAPVDRVCAPTGTEITLTMRPVEDGRWQQVASSDPTVAAVGPLGFDLDGNTYVTVTAARVGTARVTAVARPPDTPPNGLPRQRWELTVSVIA